MSELWMRRGLKGLEPLDDSGLEVLRRLKQGDVIKAEITKPRNIRHHRKLFALLNLVWSSCGDWPSVEDLLTELKKRMGLYDECGEIVDRATGQVFKVVKLRSISFSAMDQSEFDTFFEKAIRTLCQMVGGLEENVLRDEVLAQLAAA